MLRRLAIRVVLAEDNYLVREGMRQLLAAEADIDVVADGATPLSRPGTRGEAP